jgi:hypothetical protein
MPSSTSRHGSRDPHDRRRLAILWAGFLAGPLIFLAVLQANYVLSYVSCETRETWFLHTLTLAGVLLVSLVGWRCWVVGVAGAPLYASSDDLLGQPVSESRAVWMGYAGTGISAWFAVAIASMDIPVLVLRTCQ